MFGHTTATLPVLLLNLLHLSGCFELSELLDLLKLLLSMLGAVW